jgi:serpin B
LKDSNDLDMMYNLDDYRYWENRYLKILELPYKWDLSMIVILPKKKKLISLLEKKLTYNNLQRWLNLFEPWVGEDYRVKVWLPKFKFKTSYRLKKILQSVWLETILKWNIVNFPFISNVSLGVDKVIHKAYVDVNEQWTEAAAVTAITVVKAALPTEFKKPKIYEFKADHPFIFLIKDNRTGAILFMWKIVNPNS